LNQGFPLYRLTVCIHPQRVGFGGVPPKSAELNRR
jgi:hypothetical protein